MGRAGWLPLAESCHRITIQDLSKDGRLRDGRQWKSEFSWSNGLFVEAECLLEPPNCRSLRLRYEVEDYYGEMRSVDETLYLERFPQPLGGFRWYFICPTANRRCTVLYLPPSATRFRSRWG